MRNCHFWCRLVATCCVIATAICSNSIAADKKGSSRSVSKASYASPAGEVREFDVRVDNKTLGSHRLTIKSNGDEHTVGIQTDVKVDVIIYSYAFKFRGTEVWRDGKLTQTDVQCEDNGKKRSFTLKSDGKLQLISFNGKSQKDADDCVMTTSYWKLPHANVRDKILPIADIESGKTTTANLDLVGPDTVSLGGRTIQCRHYKIDGPSPADLWFDDRDLLVKQKSVERGHLTELRLKQIRAAKEDK